MKNNHTEEFYMKKYKELKQFADDKNITFPYKNIREFKSTWNALREDGIKNVDKAMKYGLQYETGYKTALAEYRVAKELGIDVKLKELKQMTTTDFAERNQSKIMQMYHDKRAEGLTGDQAGAFISTYWFGSE